MKEKILVTITNYYINSRDFNGIQIQRLLKTIGAEWQEAQNDISALIREEKIRIIDESTDINPNIIRIGFDPVESQIKKASTDEPGYMCLYPTPNILEQNIDQTQFAGQPFKLRLALGDAQLSYTVFDLSVLEFYRNDPRYHYENDDMQGKIYYNNGILAESDKAFIETYGFAYDDEYNRAVAVFIRYLSDLTPEHQQIWKTKEITSGNFKLHQDYYRNTIIGDWGKKVPICQAFLKELYVINEMAYAMMRPPLFRESYGKEGEKRPRKFHFLIRPTLEEFNSFVLLFDKMISDNINKDFFMNEIDYKSEVEREDGKVVITQKGTLQLLNEWVRKNVKLENWNDWDEAIGSLKKVRKFRQQPAHAIKEDKFDQQYFRQQRELIIEVYRGVRLIRLIFANHPKVKNANIDIPDWLYKGEIWHI